MRCLKPALAVCYLLGLGAFSVLSSPAKAQLLGATVDVTANFPTNTAVFVDPGNRVVTNAIEYPVGSYSNYNSSFQVDISGSQFILMNTGASSGATAAAFNGFVLKVLSGPTILSASIDPSSGFLPTSVTVMNGNEIDINYSGSTFLGGRSSIVNIQTSATAPSTPEPGSLALLTGLSLTGAGFLRRRKARKSV